MGAYSDLPFEYMFVEQADINPFVLASDELNVPWPDKFGKLMNRGAMNPYNATGRLWINMYEGIRKANLFLEYIHLTELDKNFTQEDKDVWIGEAILLRALYHYYVVRTYGPCVILDRVMMPNDDFMQMYRNTLDECVEFILKELDRAIDMLPMQITDRTQLGRVTAAGAYAVKARLLLYRASDLWNGNPFTRISPILEVFTSSRRRRIQFGGSGRPKRIWSVSQRVRRLVTSSIAIRRMIPLPTIRISLSRISTAKHSCIITSVIPAGVSRAHSPERWVAGPVTILRRRR